MCREKKADHRHDKGRHAQVVKVGPSPMLSLCLFGKGVSIELHHPVIDGDKDEYAKHNHGKPDGAGSDQQGVAELVALDDGLNDQKQ